VFISIVMLIVLKQYGINDQAVCGNIKYDEDTGKVRLVEWMGICQRGQCVVCSDYGGLVVAYPHVLCGDRICVGRHLNPCKLCVLTLFSEWNQHALSMFLSWQYFKDNPVVISVIVLFGELSLLLLAICICGGCLCCRIKKSAYSTVPTTVAWDSAPSSMFTGASTQDSDDEWMIRPRRRRNNI